MKIKTAWGGRADVLTTEVIDYCAANGWESIMWSVLTNEFTTAESVNENYISYFDLLSDAGLKVRMEIELPMQYNIPAYNTSVPPYIYPDTSEDTYISLYGDGLAEFEGAGNVLLGYSFEGGYVNGINWLKANTSKEVVTYWMNNYYLPNIGSAFWETWWGPEGTYAPTKGTLDWRIEQFDSIFHEVYWLSIVPQAIELGEYINANHPNTPHGFLSNFSPSADGEHFWGPNDDSDPYTPIPQQQANAFNSIVSIADAIGLNGYVVAPPWLEWWDFVFNYMSPNTEKIYLTNMAYPT